MESLNYQMLISKKESILISFSGGPDSVFLLEVLERYLGLAKITLIYFDHGLRPDEVIKEKSFVMDISRKKGVRAIIKKIPVKAYVNKYSTSIEMAGRNLRYSLLKHYAKLLGVKTIVTGHHLDDVMETFFQKLIRGAKTNLGSINKERLLGASVRLVRPLLDIEKQDILGCLNSNNIDFMLDSSNKDDCFGRNKIRNKLLPVISEINPQYKKAVAGFQGYVIEQKEFIESLLVNVFWQIEVSVDSVSISIKAFFGLADFLIKIVLVKFLNELKTQNNNGRLMKPDIVIEAKHVHVLLGKVKELVKSNTEKDIILMDLPQGYVAMFEAARLVLKKKKDIEKVDYLYLVEDITVPLEIKEVGVLVGFQVLDNKQDNYRSCETEVFLDYDRIENEQILVRNRKPGDVFRPFGLEHDKKIKNYFIDKKISKQIRATVPLFFTQSNLVWVMGYQVSDLYKVTKKTQKVLKIIINKI